MDPCCTPFEIHFLDSNSNFQDMLFCSCCVVLSSNNYRLIDHKLSLESFWVIKLFQSTRLNRGQFKVACLGCISKQVIERKSNFADGIVMLEHLNRF